MNKSVQWPGTLFSVLLLKVPIDAKAWIRAIGTEVSERNRCPSPRDNLPRAIFSAICVTVADSLPYFRQNVFFQSPQIDQRLRRGHILEWRPEQRKCQTCIFVSF